MPNDCNNRITITSPVETDIITILDDIIDIPNTTVHQSGKNGMRCTIITGWAPDYQWIEELIKKYPSCWVKNEWLSEDGQAGIWVGDCNKHSTFEWIDLSIEDDIYLFRQ